MLQSLKNRFTALMNKPPQAECLKLSYASLSAAAPGAPVLDRNSANARNAVQGEAYERWTSVAGIVLISPCAEDDFAKRVTAYETIDRIARQCLSSPDEKFAVIRKDDWQALLSQRNFIAEMARLHREQGSESLVPPRPRTPGDHVIASLFPRYSSEGLLRTGRINATTLEDFVRNIGEIGKAPAPAPRAREFEGTAPWNRSGRRPF